MESQKNEQIRVSERFQTFCQENKIQHFSCPVKDHRGNEKVERMIRTINERLRNHNNIVIEKDTKGISKTLFALRTEKRKDGKSPFEKHTNRKPNTPKKIILKLVDFRERSQSGPIDG